MHEGFLRLLATQYGAEATTVSFADPSAAATINGWVQDQTRGRIDRLFDRLDPSTVLVLANAVYLKTTWAAQFDAASTTDGAFTTSDGSVTAPLMHQRLAPAAYDDSADWQRVQLPHASAASCSRCASSSHAAYTTSQRFRAAAAGDRPRRRGTALSSTSRSPVGHAHDVALLGPIGQLGRPTFADLTASRRRPARERRG